MDSEAKPRPPSPERFRDYLHLLARTHLGNQFKGKLDASDVVQQTLLDAHKHLPMFRGNSDGEMAAWLRRILACCLSNATHALERGKRDLRRERSIQNQLDASSARLEDWLVAHQPTPSHRLRSEERALEVAMALRELPDAQQQALVLKYCQGWTLDQIAEHMGKTSYAVSSLLQRGSRQLRSLLQDRSMGGSS